MWNRPDNILLMVLWLALWLATQAGAVQKEKEPEIQVIDDGSAAIWPGRTYLDLTDEEKKQIRYFKSEREKCFRKHVWELDNGTKDPLRIAKKLAQSCDEHLSALEQYLRVDLKMNERFITNYMLELKRETGKVFLVNVVLEEREARRQREERAFLGIKDEATDE